LLFALGETVSTLPPDVMARLRPHVIDLNQGHLSSGGSFTTSEADVTAIFRTHLPAWLETAESPAVVFWAHGGLVDESSGLRIAADQLDWWKANGVYPIFFVWESGLVDALGALLGRHEELRALTRDLFDWTTDPLVEATARTLGGPKVWTAMKVSAENASGDDGGATLAARLLKELCDTGAGFTLHAVGHSAGAIFHRFFLERTKNLGVPAFRTLSLLAPAITIDEFTRGLMPLAGEHVDSVRMYTMHRDYEQADVCGARGVDFYHKSLLYLIYYALEPEPRTPILGLEESVLSDPTTSEFFREGRAPEKAKIVWSVGPDSASTSHGGFDNDPATMNSLVRHIRDVAEPTVPFPGVRGVSPADRVARPPARRRSEPGKTALCIGINDYPAPNALGGCVADAQAWAEVLDELGFETTTLLDGDATRANILEAIQRVVESTADGEVGVVQYSGHGTQVADIDGDEVSDHLDEALVPVDFETGAFIIDDDLRNIFAAIRAGANLTCFMDCCFSESNTRLLRIEQPRVATSAQATARFLPRSDEQDRHHREFRDGRRSLEVAGGSALSPMMHVSFSACRDFQVALESNGHGHFTAAATPLLRDPEALTWTNVEFFQRILGAIEAGQTPTLEPAGDSRRVLGRYATRGNADIPTQTHRSANGRVDSRGAATTPA
jgi:hypothetical protein